MALDHALARECAANEGVLRFYGWASPTVSLGRNEPARGRYDMHLAEALGIGFVRRPTGGRAVLHDDEVTYAVVAPIGALGGLRETYLRINRALVDGLVKLGVRARLAAEGRVLRPDAGPCFQAPTPGEVTADGGKLIGSAQARVEGALLQHGSIILGGDQSRLARMAGETGDPHPPATLYGMLRRVDRAAIVAGLAEAMRLALGGSWSERGYRSRELKVADELLVERYASSEWTWRR